MQRLMLFIVTITLGVFVMISPAHAQSAGTATFTLDPDEGVVIQGKEFSIDVILRSGGNTLSSARLGMEFDPSMLEVTKVQYDSLDQSTGSLFCQFPETSGQYVVDNDQGIIVVTGIASGTNECPYFSQAEGIFARIFFEPLDTGTTTISFIVGNQATASAITDNKSPPQPVLTAQPASASYTIIASEPTPTAPLPNTGLLSNGLLAVSVVLALGGIIAVFWQTRKQSN